MNIKEKADALYESLESLGRVDDAFRPLEGAVRRRIDEALREVAESAWDAGERAPKFGSGASNPYRKS